MVIDFHTHIFPEKIAPRTIETLETRAHIKATCEGTLDGLKTSMHQNGVNYSVVLPVVTKPSQFDSINDYSQSINNQDGIIAFGGIHPQNEDIKGKLLHIKELGLKGIKIHPDYQDAYIDDERYIEIIKTCIELDLCCVIHAGLDIGIPTPIHCPPDRAYIMLQEVLKDCNKDSKIVLAHIGGHLQWDLVEELLVGQNVYFDLAYSLPMIQKEQLLRIIENHGSDRILYATDSPWSGAKESIAYVNTLPLEQEDKNNILYKNAMRILDM